MRATAWAQLAAAFKGHLRVFTDVSVALGSRSCATAFTIPTLRLDWGSERANFASSTTAKVGAITEALRALVQLHLAPYGFFGTLKVTFKGSACFR